ncbi:MAG: MATE family efflux transporter [Lachnospiraceae bacterium]|nr:MATE family efflux transporter [Lachnospiraceae bacterium]
MAEKSRNSGYENEFGTAPMWPLIMKMAIPCITAQIVYLLYNIVDRIYIGHLPEVGTDALAGVGVCSPVIMLVAAFAMIVGGGGGPLTSIALGQDDRKKAEQYLGNGLTLLVISSVVMMLILYLFMELILRTVGASDKTIGYSTEYLSIYLIGTIFGMVTIGLISFINAQGRPVMAMIAVLLGTVTNVVLDPILMFGFHMGVRGAAIATVFSLALSGGFILWFLLSPRASLRIKKENLRLRKDMVVSMLSLGISPFVMSVTESLIGFVLNGSLAHYGDIYVSALAIMTSAMQFISIPLTGFSQGANPVISYNFGHGDAGRLKEGLKVMGTVMVGYNFVMTLLLMLFPAVFSGMFTSDPELIRTVSAVMPVFLAGMLIFGLQRTFQNMFISMDEAKISLFIALLRKVILLIPLALILPRFLGVMGVFWAEAAADALAALTCTGLFIFRFRKILSEMESREDAFSADPENAAAAATAAPSGPAFSENETALKVSLPYKKVTGFRLRYENSIARNHIAASGSRYYFGRGVMRAVSARNNRYNGQFDPIDGYIGKQNGGGPADLLRYGIYRMRFNGCEVIAVYNLLRYLGGRRDIREIAEAFEKKGLALLGSFGTTPDAIREYLNEVLREERKYNGILARFKAEAVMYPSKDAERYDEILAEAGCGILTFWNGERKWSIHTVMLHCLENGGIRVYNQYTNVLYNEYASVEHFLINQGRPYPPISLIVIQK